MLKRTRNLLIDTHLFLESINYDFNNDSSFNLDKIINTILLNINRTSKYDDAFYLYDNFCKIIKNFDKIAKKVKKYNAFWNSIECDTEKIELNSSENSIGNYYLSNIYENNYKKVFLQAESLDNLALYEFVNNKHQICSDLFDNPYYFEFAKKSTKAYILNPNKEKLCTVELIDCEVTLKDNKTIYDIIKVKDSVYGIFNKDYISAHKDDYDIEECLAIFHWTIVDFETYLGFAEIQIFEESDDLNLFLLLALSGFTLYAHNLSSMQASSHSSVVASMIFWNNFNILNRK